MMLKFYASTSMQLITYTTSRILYHLLQDWLFILWMEYYRNWDLGFRDTFRRGEGYSQEGQMANRGRDGFGRRFVEQNFVTNRYGETSGRDRSLQNDNAWNKSAFYIGSREIGLKDKFFYSS